MGVGQRERGQEGERLAAEVTDASANLNPIMIFIVRLFLSATVTDNGVLTANRASAQDTFHTRLGPIASEVVLCSREWDKENRDKGAPFGLAIWPRDLPERSPSLLAKISTGKNIEFPHQLDDWRSVAAMALAG